jgi:hypothetical protein
MSLAVNFRPGADRQDEKRSNNPAMLISEVINTTMSGTVSKNALVSFTSYGSIMPKKILICQ